MLIPANRTEQQWWQEHVEPYRDLPGSGLHVEFLPGRMRFLAPGQAEVGPDERPPFGCCLLIWEAREAISSPRLVPGAVVQVRVTQREPPLQRAGVAVVRARRPRGEGVGGCLQCAVRRGDAGPLPVSASIRA